MYKTRQLQTTFRSSDVEKLHAAVARSAFPSENVEKLTGIEALFEVSVSKDCIGQLVSELLCQVVNWSVS